ncbi:mannose-1-phosphate guanylyltransferase/mannose-6-phosphate isomerase [Pseudorhodoplanes sinuspersici]|uniref:mannose-1-phosphate guanylyltransferase n=1 Tax=Pseudorhodoplanes sinuspersici TaxID=1235591 RepID=A0A1W6ZTQ0_9HYPH|nr:mannose-1-phosphate guanylyltransferase/mannose-6-phosphate isomerase [Pseudorhodoplanes sinuspersici]ARQ00722.1 mannose-1-phosphate guanylyltransferase/mannose-6-phosphate isomerase [Pseudorhodoplanes sinuspersici]RKE72330.1 mannose-1-phosphate guanylyltransferase (GDP) /mannose-6-phosphate isomerase type 2 [Pseudorhodoplanes sinuspersici]
MNQTAQSDRIVPLVMCGGAGTRLWPSSREGRPKQFLPLLGSRSTFQETMLRVADAAVFARSIIITNTQYRFIVKDQLSEIGVEADIMLEPMRRDSGPAIAAGAVFASRRDGNPVMVALAADHVVTDKSAFVTACREASGAAREGRIVTFGVKPDRSATEYGYICPGAKLHGDIFTVERFVEKPDAKTAQSYIEQGYLWNSGNFVFAAEDLLAEYSAFEAATVTAAKAAVDAAGNDLGFITIDPEGFGRAKPTSIDYAVMEKTKRAAVIPVSYGWSDVGSWHAVWELSQRDENGNAAQGNAVFVDTKNSFASSEKPLIALFGVQDLVVVASEDAVLIADRKNTAEMKRLVQTLKEVAPAVTEDHIRVHRPWGNYQSLDNGDRYQVKRIVVKKGGRLSLQYHNHRAEHWVVVRGTARVTIGDQVTTLHENQSIYIPLGQPHRLENPGKIDLELIEVQTGSYLGEDDIVRIEDDYRRS